MKPTRAARNPDKSIWDSNLLNVPGLAGRHGAGDPSLVDVSPEGADIALQGLGWASSFESGIGEHTITSGIEGSWVNTPTQWSENYFRLLLDYEYELVKSPAGAQQWQPIDQKPEDMKLLSISP